MTQPLVFEQLAPVDRHAVVVAYDTPSNRRRRQFAKLALGYASRVQKSVYEAHLTDIELRILTKSFNRIALPAEDDVRLYPQCARCSELRQMLGKAVPAAMPTLIVA